MSTRMIIKGPDVIDCLQVEVGAVPRVNEIVEFSGIFFRVTRVVHNVVSNYVALHVIFDE